jgi:hypothetical protein
MTKSKRITITTSIFIIALCLIGCIVSVQLFIEGCLWWECAPNRSFDVLDLELPSNLFPVNAIYNTIHLGDDDDPETKRSSGQTIYWDNGNGLAIYIVDMYASNKNSSRNFERTKNSFFSDRGDSKILWSKPDELTYISPWVDIFFVACGTLIGNDYRCGVVAQYQEFVLFFNATISERMTYQDFQKIIIYMDEQMSNYLYKK